MATRFLKISSNGSMVLKSLQMSTRFFIISSNGSMIFKMSSIGNKTFKNLVKWQQDMTAGPQSGLVQISEFFRKSICINFKLNDREIHQKYQCNEEEGSEPLNRDIAAALNNVALCNGS